MPGITEHLSEVKKRIRSAAESAGRSPSGVRLLAVSKTHPAEAVIEAADAGQTAFGENYEQEGVAKMRAIRALRPDLMLEWHFIGPLQGNKTRPVAENFDWVHSVDRERIAKRLSEQRPKGRAPLNICLQVNISGEESKSGIRPEELFNLAETVSKLPGIRLRGLMAIPEPEKDPEKQKAPFRAMKALFDALNEKGFGLDTLSMGMSDDMAAAVGEGATVVRIGTAIFGQRDYSRKK